MVMTSTLAVTLREFARTMVTDFSRDEILSGLVDRIAAQMPVTSAGVTLISPERGPRHAAASDGAALRFEQLQSDFAEGPCMQAYATGQTCLVPDIADEDRFPQYCAAASDAGLKAAFAFPLRYGPVPLGALDLYRTTTGPLANDVIEEAQILADVVSAYLVNAQARADLKAAAVRLQAEVQRDPLTGLANRGLLMDRLEQAFRRGRRSGRPTALLFLDLDGFKAVNDEHGHAFGDALLVAVGQRLSRAVRPADTLARWAGDEFAIVCEDMETAGAVPSLIARIDAEFQKPFGLGGEVVTISASIGVAFAAQPGGSPQKLLQDADNDMYRNKRSRHWGRRPDLDGAGRPLAPEDLHAALVGAGARGELALAYQPIVTAAGGEFTGVEALLRWPHPAAGGVSPQALIALAEQSGVTVDVGGWVLTTACAQLDRWQRHLLAPIAMAVNVSARQFLAPGFVTSVADALAAAGVEPGRLTLDVTEAVLVADIQRASTVLTDLRSLGVRVSLDDFGTGVSSLRHLLHFAVDEVKIDREFITGIARDPMSAKIVAAVVALARALDITTVAEGVETREQADRLTDLGCDRCQGYYFAMPLPDSQIDGLLAHDQPDPPRLPLAS